MAKQQDFPQLRLYTSMFRVNGFPILPPLMTSEKIYEMQQIKAKAIQLEKKLEAKRHKTTQQTDEKPNNITDEPKESSYSSNGSSADTSIPAYSIRNKITEDQEKSLTMLTRLLNVELHDIVQGDDTSSNSNVSNASKTSRERTLKERMQKLQKSETFIYDYTMNEVIVPISDEDKNQLQTANDMQIKQIISTKYNLRKVEVEAAGPLASSQKSTNLTGNISPSKIPSICVNPPTPTSHGRSLLQNLRSNQGLDCTWDIPERSNTFVVNKEYCSSKPCSLDLKSPTKLSNFSPRTPRNESPRINLESCEINKPPQRSATMSSLDISNNSQPEPTLIRSNSFTVEYPSQVLLDHIRQLKAKERVVPLSTYPSYSHRITRDTVESKAKRVPRTELKIRTTPIRMPAKSSTTTSSYSQCSNANNLNNNHMINNCNNNNNNNSNINKTKRSPYDVKTAVKPKPPRQLKGSASTIISNNKQIKPKNSMPVLPTQRRAEGGGTEKKLLAKKELELSEMEVEHQEQLMQLLAQQQDEQKMLAQTFQTQKKMLLEQFAGKRQTMKSPSSKVRERNYGHPSGSMSVESSPHPKSDCSNKSPTISLSSSMISLTMGVTSPNSINGDLPSLDVSGYSAISSTTINLSHSTPRRRLFSADHVSTNERPPSRGSKKHQPNEEETQSDLQCSDDDDDEIIDEVSEIYVDAETERRADAATKINACARGFLVRRLFQTEQIQRIVQTIRDTLVFVLNLHMETIGHSEEANTLANIKLKARLLQQLSSASRTLHLVFFQTTIKERMEIIARDRKRIQTKLLTMEKRRSFRIVG